MSGISFDSKAYCKIILHAAKYPHCAVNGVLLAKTSSQKGKEVVFEDVVPLFHINLNLTPMAEIALAQIDEIASQNGLCIAGYYVAQENLYENSFDKAENRITDKIPANFSHPCIVVLDNTKLTLNLDNIAIKVAQYSDGSYRPCELNRISLESDRTLDACSHLLEMKLYNSLIDFDNHLDNISLDWLNHEINKEIECRL